MKLDDPTELLILIATLRNCEEFELLIMTVGVIKEDNHAWRQMSSLFIEKAKCYTVGL